MGKKTWRFRAALLTLATFALGVTPAFGTDQKFTLHNHTRHIMKSLSVSPAGEDQWSSDILGQDILDDHTDLVVKFPRENDDCKWDVRADFADGSTEQVHDVDFCAVSEVTFTP